MERRDFIEALLNKREIYLDDYINDESVEKIIKLLMFLNAKNDSEEITLYINSNGGEVVEGLRLYNFIKHILSAPVTGIVIGNADSMAIVVLQACKIRKALKTSTFYLHNLRLEVKKEWNEFKSFAEKELEGIKKAQEEVFQILGEIGKLKEIKELSERKTTIDANQAFELGLIDEIVS